MDASNRDNLASSLKLCHHHGEPCGAYDVVAKGWGQHITTSAWAHFHHLIVEKVKLGAVILDAGTGTGERTLALLQYCQPGEIIALDTYELFSSNAREKTALIAWFQFSKFI